MRKREHLTPTEIAFAEAYAATHDHIYAAEKAGYADPPSGASRALRRPAVQALIRERESAVLRDELLPLATNVLREALTNSTVPWNPRLKAVEIVHKRVFGEHDAASGKNPAEMSPAELSDTLSRLQRELSERAKPVLEHQAPIVEAIDETEDNSPKPSVFE